ncbi:MAG: primosomal protein N' [Spirochaetota bacterium]
MPRYAHVAFNIPARRSFSYELPEAAACGIGYRVVAPFGSTSRIGYVIGADDRPPEGDFKLKCVEKVIDAEPLFDEEQVQLAEWVSKMYICSLGEALAAMLPGAKRESKISVIDENDMTPPEKIHLSDEQKSAVAKITELPAGMFYLYGVTGSGKTEVFLQAAGCTLKEGKSVIYLVPEISLTHQVIDTVRLRFGELAAIIHSGLTPSQKLEQWRRIRKGDATIVVGARSAVFSPVRNLGLIIIDEEHESSYKSGATPRYHARQVAMHRCSVSGSRLVMGSATPSVEAFYLMNKGRINALNLSQRLSGGRMPEISIVDMKKEKGSISGKLALEIRNTYREHRQTILFLNRRGFAYFFHCRTCGYEMKCRQCSVALTYHKSRNRMLCHYCGFTTAPAEICPACGSLDIGYSGFGTEKIEEDVRTMFPELRIERLDTDSVGKRGSMRQLLADFKAGEIDLLLGTQMVAKGLNFPGVKLVGIILADTSLHLPDFRAAERTFSLAVQVSGRAGRYFPDGKVIIQTFRPEHDAIKCAASGAIHDFYNRELSIRESLGFPPFSRLFRIVFRGKNKGKVESSIRNFTRRLIHAVRNTAEVAGPAECPLTLISGNYRYQILARTNRFSESHSTLRMTLAAFTPPAGVYIETDIDPVSLL